MQIHEITKINEGFMDAIKGIGSVAAQGINQTLGTNIGGAEAGAAAAPGQRQQTALQINTQLAQQQAQQLARNYAKIAGQPGIDPATLRNELNRIVFKQLLPRITSINDLADNIDPSLKQVADQLARRINSAMTTLSNPRTATNTALSQKVWTGLTTAALQYRSLSRFRPGSKPAPAAPTAPAAPAGQADDDITINADGEQFYRGRPYDPSDPNARQAMSQFLLKQQNLVANRP